MNNTQLVRIVDIGFIAPFLIIVGFVYTRLPLFVRIILIVIGISTLIYNLINFIKEEQK